MSVITVAVLCPESVWLTEEHAVRSHGFLLRIWYHLGFSWPTTDARAYVDLASSRAEHPGPVNLLRGATKTLILNISWWSTDSLV